jgi:uncharacterized protein YndB with AHSA1/START domain
MARTERLIGATPATVFDVLADPRSYAYWVIGSREIRSADDSWPQPGSRFAHTVNAGPLRVRDHTEVEAAQPGRRLQLKAKARPLGTARVTIDLEPAGAATRVTIVEDPADAFTAFVFLPPMHWLVRRRNDKSLDRLAELAEGRRPMPGEEPEAAVRRPGEGGPVVNPALHERDGARRRVAAAIVRGALAGLAGALTMSISTNAEMRLRGRPPSDAPVRAIERLLGIRIRGRRAKVAAGAAGHLGASLAVGVARGALDAARVPSRAAGAATLGLALSPEVLVLPALRITPPPWRWGAAESAVSALHHAVYASTVVVAYDALARRAG